MGPYVRAHGRASTTPNKSEEYMVSSGQNNYDVITAWIKGLCGTIASAGVFTLSALALSLLLSQPGSRGSVLHLRLHEYQGIKGLCIHWWYNKVPSTSN